VDRPDPSQGPAWSMLAAPNPFSLELSVSISLAEKSEIDFSLMDARGKLVFSFPSTTFSPGDHQLKFPPEMIRELPAGMYFLRAVGGHRSATAKVIRVGK
jgi:hypothetical protein